MGHMGSDASYGNNGAFDLDSPMPGWRLFLICSDGTEEPQNPLWSEWEHVSVQATRRQQSRIPTWTEMVFVKDRCWDAEDVVMQLHPRRSQYVNAHPHVLHLWRSKTRPIPEPPSILVGVR
jgi:hypothetical protein